MALMSGGTGTVRHEPSVFTLALRSVPLYAVLQISSKSPFQSLTVNPKSSDERGPKIGTFLAAADGYWLAQVQKLKGMTAGTDRRTGSAGGKAASVATNV
jgi:hypothetical protein